LELANVGVAAGRHGLQLLLQVEATLEQLDPVQCRRFGQPVEGLVQLPFDRLAGPLATSARLVGLERLQIAADRSAFSRPAASAALCSAVMAAPRRVVVLGAADALAARGMALQVTDAAR